MKAHELLDRILSDLVQATKAWHAEHSEQNLQAVREYVSQNVEAIAAFVNVVYSGLNEAERRDLQKKHPELDYSAVDDDFRDIPDGILSSARHWGDKANQRIRDIFKLEKGDDIQMLLRVLRYAKYADCSAVAFELNGSPLRFE
jgi:hypothetical protein